MTTNYSPDGIRRLVAEAKQIIEICPNVYPRTRDALENIEPALRSDFSGLNEYQFGHAYEDFQQKSRDLVAAFNDECLHEGDVNAIDASKSRLRNRESVLTAAVKRQFAGE